MSNMRFYIPGALLVLTGFLVVAVPEILIVLFASFIVTAGIGLLYVGHLIRKAAEEDSAFVDGIFETLPEYGFIRDPILRRWGRKG